MDPILHKFSGAGNVFVVLDGRGTDVSKYRNPQFISFLCMEYSTDGLMILGEAPGYDFSMEFYNPDGSGGMMCGNGGRCITAFADMLGIKPSEGGSFVFLAPDGPHTALIINHTSDRDWTIRLGMKDVAEAHELLGGTLLDTGTRHLVKFVPDVEEVDVATEGKELRWREEFAPQGTNVNFVSPAGDVLHVRTFEKGVEGETLACGTGITASAIAAHMKGIAPSETGTDGRLTYRIRARIDDLSVDFLPDHSSVYLTGPATMLF